ncbi:hypothetical protein [Laspinema olomoucense]|uniref:Sec-independent protein translocase protein TatB n=1 Tax=Laspinema olomoucense D3b TaxID=2953688 RepID=A0ABT2NBA7_9CYAN|nr:hypothetical protein [Laspinema sp. D3b]MCT7979987.1 hypothetical protein [Laspinema sp. D3b]
MEPVELTAIAILVLTPIAQGALGKVGENLLEKGGNLWKRIQAKLPKLAADLKKANLTPLDYGEAVLELEAAAQEDPEIREAVQEVATQAQADQQLADEIAKIRETLKSQPPTIQNLAKLAEKIGFVNQGIIHNQTINQTF